MRAIPVMLAILSSRRLLTTAAAKTDANTLLQAALKLHQSGKLADAADLYGRVADTLGTRTPAVVHSNRGAALLALDQVKIYCTGLEIYAMKPRLVSSSIRHAAVLLIELKSHSNTPRIPPFVLTCSEYPLNDYLR